MRHLNAKAIRAKSAPFDGTTELEAAERIVRAFGEGDKRFRLMLDSLSQMIWSARADGRHDYFNRQFSDFTGLPPDALSERWGDTLLPEDRERVEALWAQTIEKGRPTGARYRVRHRSGEYRWMLSRACPIHENGRLVRWCGSLTDIHDQVLAEEALRSSQQRLGDILDSLPQMVWTNSADGRQRYYNRRWYAFTGLPVGSAHDVRRRDLIHPDDIDRALACWNRSLETGESYECEYRLRHVSGEYRWVLSCGVRQLDMNGEICWYGTTSDVHERALAREALGTSEAVNRSILDSSADGITMLDPAGRILFLNHAALKELEVEAADGLIGSPWATAIPPLAREDAQRALGAAIVEGEGHCSALRQSRSGSLKWFDLVVTPVIAQSGDSNGFVVTSRDVTSQKTNEERVRWAADHDALTALPNRTLFQARLDGALARAARTGEAIGLLLLDLDDFKQINDTLGHDAGDALLCAVAERLRDAIRGNDLAARLGGDEFAIILDGIRNADELADIATLILSRLREPFVHEGQLLDCRATLGASLYPEKGRHRAELLKQADIALYVAKAHGRGQMLLFEAKMRAELQGRNSMLALARHALDEALITPFYQPKVDLSTGQIAGFEALLRWRHPHHGIQPPATIAAAFEDLTLAAAISDCMLKRIVEDARRWVDGGVEFHHVALNAAAAEFRRGGFAERVLDQLERASLPTSALQIEVTETVFLGRGSDFVLEALCLLGQAGVKIALDDFGTGYASLTHLKQFQVDTLKIDRSFVESLATNPDDAAIIRAVIQLGHSLGIDVVAEGVETATQEQFLIGQSCDYGQGYRYGKAVPADALPDLIRRWRIPDPGIDDGWENGASDGARTRDLRRDRPAL